MMSTRYIPLMAPLVLAGCVTGYHAGAPKGAIDVIAHRGASAYAPENTLAAFRIALEQKADWFELDCHLSQDGALVVMHNGDVDKTTNGTGRISAKMLPELQGLDAGSWFNANYAGERIPTLEEALDFAKGRIGVYLEIKDNDDDSQLLGAIIQAMNGHTILTPALQQEIAALVEASGTRNLELTRKSIQAVRSRKMKHQVVIQSFSPVICFIAKTEAPDLRTEFLGSDPEDKPGQWEQFVAFGMLIDVDGFNVDDKSLTQDRLAMFHNAGKTCAVWTVDERPMMRKLAGWGVDSIITNKPDTCLATLKELGQR